jgi:hypothetical protein
VEVTYVSLQESGRTRDPARLQRTADDIPVRKRLRAGSQTGPLDLKGRDRAIDSVEMVYKSRPNFKGLATVCVDGLHS